MQVARNIILEERDKTISRKLREIGISWGLEIDHSKDEILDAYLNYIDFGNQAMGIQMASKIYFDKDLTKDELEPQEVALLAGLPKATTTYNPYLNPEKVEATTQCSPHVDGRARDYNGRRKEEIPKDGPWCKQRVFV